MIRHQCCMVANLCLKSPGMCILYFVIFCHYQLWIYSAKNLVKCTLWLWFAIWQSNKVIFGTMSVLSAIRSGGDMSFLTTTFHLTMQPLIIRKKLVKLFFKFLLEVINGILNYGLDFVQLLHYCLLQLWYRADTTLI